jgi:hypothetical protein
LAEFTSELSSDKDKFRVTRYQGPPGRTRRRWVDNISIDFGEVGWGDVGWNGLPHDRNRWRALVNSVLNLRLPYDAGKLSNGFKNGGLSSSDQLHIVSYNVATCTSCTVYTVVE